VLAENEKVAAGWYTSESSDRCVSNRVKNLITTDVTINGFGIAPPNWIYLVKNSLTRLPSTPIINDGAMGRAKEFVVGTGVRRCEEFV
jgi:hypothetical protein